MKLRYKFLAYILSASIILVTVFSSYCQSVYAVAGGTIVTNVVIPLLTSFGVSVADEAGRDFWDWITNNDDAEAQEVSEIVRLVYANYREDGYQHGGGGFHVDGDTVVITESVVTMIRSLFDEYLAENPEVIDVVWIPVITEKNLKASWFSSLEDYGRSSALLNTHDLVAFRAPNVYYTIGDSYLTGGSYADLSNIVMYGNFDDSFINAINYITPNFGSDTTTGTVFRCNFADENGVGVYWYNLGWQTYDANNGSWVSSSNLSTYGFFMLLNPFFKGSLSFRNNDILILCASSSSGIHYVPYFKSLSAYKDYVTGNGNYYRFESGYTGGDITINPDADYSEITDAIKDAMQEAIQSGKSVTAALSNMQKAFTSALDKINGTLGDISDNTAEMNEWLEKIYQKLSEIYNTDDDNDSAFDILFSGLRSMTVLMELYDTHMDDRFLRLEALLYSYFSSASENLSESKGFLENISDKLDDIYKKLKQILFVESADLAWDILSKLFDSINDWIKNKFSEFGLFAGAATVGEVMKTKFPFSIPWDIYAILLMFDAPAKPPVISLHFEFPFIDFEWDYEYVMDDKAWSDLATVCRFFLTIGYEITLIHLTQKLYAAGLFDIPSVGRKKH